MVLFAHISGISGLHAETDKALKEAVYNRLVDQSKNEALQAENEVLTVQKSLVANTTPSQIGIVISSVLAMPQSHLYRY